MATLEERQEYYQYGLPGAWAFKQPPSIDPSLQKTLTEMLGVDRFGDPRWRFNWGGARIVQKRVGDPQPDIQGNRAALKLDGGRLDPDNPAYIPSLRSHCIYGRQMEPSSLCYTDDDGHKVRITRPEFAPPNKVVEWEFDHVLYGQLHWFLEAKLTPEELVQAGIYRESEQVPPSGEYIWKLTIQTPEGLYFEPSELWIEMVLKHQRENENESLADLKLMDREARETAKANKDAEIKASKTRLVEALMSRELKTPIHELFQR